MFCSVKCHILFSVLCNNNYNYYDYIVFGTFRFYDTDINNDITVIFRPTVT